MINLLIDLKFRRVLLIGEGEEFYFKLEKLSKEAEELFTISEVSLKSDEDIIDKIKEVNPDILVLATERLSLVKKIKEAFPKVLINVVDHPELCDFYFVANKKIGSLEIGVATGGKSPALASLIRRRLEKYITPMDIKLLDLLSKVRKYIKDRIKEKDERRKAIYRIINSEEIRRLLKEGKEEEALEKANELIDKKEEGKVYLVGAGPGRPDLITLAGIKALKRADVIIFDRLVSKSLLKFAERAKKIYGGKEPGKNYLQEEINRIMLEEAKKGKVVVRLKNGDPCIFGRGSEEYEFLKANGIEVHIIPGVSSATGVASFNKIPLTRRDLSSSFTVVSMVKAGGETLDIRNLAKFSDTLVILMGLSRAKEIREQLNSIGLGKKPVCVISKGTTKAQRILFTTVEELPDSVKDVKPPAIIIIGDIVNLVKN
ncbi:Siroheme synthase [archaeon HR06]|nr:Siroheme synthase [archaeon HR06]